VKNFAFFFLNVNEGTAVDCSPVAGLPAAFGVKNSFVQNQRKVSAAF
jgi:hypothetical protein